MLKIVKNLPLVTFLLLFFTALNGFASERLGPSLKDQAKIKAKGDGAQTLYSIRHSVLNDNNEWTRTSYYSIRILDNEAARDYGRIAIPYNHFYNAAKLEFANVLTAAGVVKPVADDAIQIRTTGGGQDFYDDQSEIVFSLPDVAPGSIIEFQFESTTLKRAITTVEFDGVSPFWFQQRVAQDGWRADAVQYFSYTLDTPAGIDFTTQVRGPYRSEAKETRTESRRVRTWEWKKVAGIALEAAMLPEYKVMPTIKSSSSTDWQRVNDWAWEKISPRLAKTPALKQVIEQLNLPANASREEKIKAVYEFVNTRVRYVFAHLGRGGYDPHSPDETLAAGYGDCKDQSVLTAALLNALGVPAYAALVETPRSGLSQLDLVRLIFDHMVVWIPGTATAPPVWLDTTGDRTLFPGMSNHMIGQPALIVNGEGGRVTHVEGEFEPNLALLELVYSESDKGYSQVEATYSPQGAFEQVLRSWWTHDTNRESSLQRLFEGVFSNTSEYVMEAEVLNAESLWQPLQIRALFKFNKGEKREGPPSYATSFRQVYSLAGDLPVMQIPASRENIYVNSLPVKMVQRVTFKGGAADTPALLQQPDSTENAYFTLTQNGVLAGSDYRVDIAFSRPSLELDVAEYKDYYDALVDLGGLGIWMVSMQEDKRKQADVALASSLADVDEGSWQSQLTLAKHHLDLGQFEQALPAAQAAVRLAPEQGEAWYVLGTVQGFNSLIEESSASFDKALQLGYTP